MGRYISLKVLELRDVDTGFKEQCGYNQYETYFFGEEFQFTDLDRLSLFHDWLYEKGIKKPEINFHHYCL